MENRQELVQNIVTALGQSLNPSNQVRAQAEQFIKQAEKVPGYVSSLLQISADTSFNQGQQTDINHAAAVQLGKMVDYHWKFVDVEQAQKISVSGFEFIIIDPQDKALVRENIMQSLHMAQNKKIMKQYVRCITTIARYDHPTSWPNLLPQIAQFLIEGQKSDEKAVLAGLLALKGLVKKYEYEMEDERQPLYEIVGATFGILGGLINQVLDIENELAYEILYLISKIFYTSNQLYLCPFLQEKANIDPWMTFFNRLMNRPLPAALDALTEDMEEIERRDKSVCWKTKGMASQVTYRLFSKYGNAKHVDKRYARVSALFDEAYSVMLLETHLQQVLRRQAHFVGSKALNFSIKFVSQSTKMKLTMDKLKPFVEKLLFEVIVSPVMLITHRDITLYSDDPIEYIRKQNDFTETLFTPKNTAVDLLTYLNQYKSKKKQKLPDFIQAFLFWCAKNLSEYKQALASGTIPADGWRIKEAILFAIGSLLEDITAFKSLRVMVEPMLIEHVLHELHNPQPFLRMRALWLYGEFVKNMEFKQNGHLAQVVECAFKCLCADSDLPVRLHAAFSVSKLLQNETACSLLKPHLSSILESYLKLMNEIESEELVQALEEIVSLYRDDIDPFATQLAEQLVNSYHRLVQTNPEDDDGESALAAQGCVVTIRRILDSISKNQELLLKIEEIIIPVLMFTLTPDGLDSIEDSLDCIAMILYHGPQGRVSQRMWKLFPQLLYVVCGDEKDPDGGYGFEYISQIAVSLQNYISKDPETFLTIGEGQTQTYLALTFRYVEKALKVNATSEHMLDGVVVLKVLIAMLENIGEGKINDALPYIVKICLEQLGVNPQLPKSYLSMIMQTVSMCFWYNAPLTFQILQGALPDGQAVASVFQNLLQVIKSVAKHDFEYRRFIFGLTSIVSTPPQHMPAIIVQNLPTIMKELAVIAEKMKKERVKILEDNEKHLVEEEERRKKREAGEDSDEGDEDGFVDDDEGDSDNDSANDDEAATLHKIEQLRKKGKTLEGAGDDEGDGDDDDDENDSDYEYTAGDLAIYDSALDDVDELIYIRTNLEKLNALDANYTAQLLSGMEPETLQKFNTNMNEAQALKEREEIVRKKCDELDEKQPPGSLMV